MGCPGPFIRTACSSIDVGARKDSALTRKSSCSSFVEDILWKRVRREGKERMAVLLPNKPEADKTHSTPGTGGIKLAARVRFPFVSVPNLQGKRCPA